MRCERHRGPALLTCVHRKGVVPTRDDVGVGDTRQPLEAVALLVFAYHLDEEALGGSA